MKKLKKRYEVKRNTLEAFSMRTTNACTACKCACDCNLQKPSASQQSYGQSLGGAMGEASNI